MRGRGAWAEVDVPHAAGAVCARVFEVERGLMNRPQLARWRFAGFFQRRSAFDPVAPQIETGRRVWTPRGIDREALRTERVS